MSIIKIFKNYLNFISRFLPKSPQPDIIGFDIGTSSVKVIELGFVDDGYVIKNWALEPIDGSDTLGALKRSVLRLNISNQMLVSSVSGKGTLIRYIDMPRMSIDEIKKAFVYEIDKYFPFDPQTIYTDCCVLDPLSKEKKISVLVVASKKELVDERLKLFKDANIDLDFITTNSIATANAFGQLVRSNAEKQGARAILDIGGSVSNLMILDKNNSPCFTRDIYVGSQEMSKQIANNLGILPTHADQLKAAPGDRLLEIIKACEESLENLTSELHLSFDYFMTERNTSVTELYLVGGGALFKGIETAFEKSLNISVKVWNPLESIKIDPSSASADINKYSSQLSVAIGLALTKS